MNMDTYGVNDLLVALDIEAEIEKSHHQTAFLYRQEPSSSVPAQDLSDEQLENLKRLAERENAQ